MAGHISDKKARIKNTARRLFIHYGYAKTNMEDIACAMHVSKATLYYYYSAKEALFREILMEEAEQLLRKIDARLTPEQSATEQLRLFFQLIFNNLVTISREITDKPEAVCDHGLHGQKLIQELHSAFNSRLQPILERGVARQVWTINDIPITLQAINNMMRFLSVEWIVGHGEKQAYKTFTRILDILIRGLQGTTQ
ncbi:MAG: TetR/AcrR family transcriptional regulator [Calditrichaeota bacterium]|nr:MAG: TetR/AcrR family transcriptional regulator [Calditrichota bacterium]